MNYDMSETKNTEYFISPLLLKGNFYGVIL